MGDLYRHISNHIKPEALARIENENARKFIELCISSDPADRPSAEELNKHPFLMVSRHFHPMGRMSSRSKHPSFYIND